LKRKEAPPLLVELFRLFTLKQVLFHEDRLTLVSYLYLQCEVSFLCRMMIMWKDMAITHEAQMKSVEAFKRLGNAAASEPTTSFHRHSTVELETALNK